MNRGKFLKEWQVTDKIIESIFFPIHIQPFMNDSNSRNNNFYSFKNSQMDMRGCVWVPESFLRNDKWQIKFFTLEQQNKGPVM